jgi:hypothetical protein
LSPIAPKAGPLDTTLQGPPISPAQRIYLYNDAEWEQFVEEWASGLGIYAQVMRMGGSGDRGVDVAGFKTTRRFDGPWDCFQAKHYARPISPADAHAEILKLFVHVAQGDYPLPDRYYFVAPKGCSTSLKHQLGSAPALQGQFLSAIGRGAKWVAQYRADVLAQVRSLASDTDFAIFRTAELMEMLKVHAGTPYHAARFGMPLPPRPATVAPPAGLASHEARYVDQLVDVYSEKYPNDDFVREGLASHPKAGKHFQRQRLAFYSAEMLRVYSRDSVPEGTFEALQNDVHSGVIEVADAPHASGMDRLTAVLTTAVAVHLDRHRLIERATVEDRKGICHQLANDDRLHWMADQL